MNLGYLSWSLVDLIFTPLGILIFLLPILGKHRVWEVVLLILILAILCFQRALITKHFYEMVHVQVLTIAGVSCLFLKRASKETVARPQHLPVRIFRIISLNVLLPLAILIVANLIYYEIYGRTIGKSPAELSTETSFANSASID